MSRPYRICKETGKSEDGKVYWKEVGVFWKNDRDDAKSIGTIQLYYPEATFAVFGPSEERPREQRDTQRKPKW